VKDSDEIDRWVRMTIPSGSEESEMMSRKKARVTDIAVEARMKLGQTILEG
jgi:hypothetical protein